MACCAFAAWLFGLLVNGFRAVTDLADSTVSTLLVSLGVALCAGAVWLVALGVFPYSDQVRLTVLVIAIEAAAMVGLALIVAPDPLYGGAMGVADLSPTADQRMGGAIMMLVELIVVLPLAATLIRGRDSVPVSGRPA